MEHTAPGYQFHSGILVDNVLFDLGDKRFLEREPEAIFLTHLHVDHAFFVEEEWPPFQTPIYAPERWEGHPEIKVVRHPVKVGELTVTPVPTNHSARVRSSGYIIEDGTSRMMYTGDLISVWKKFRERLPDLDLVITDGAFIRRGGLVRRDEEGRLHGHTGIPNLVSFFSQLTGRIVFTHFGSWFFKDVDRAKREIAALSSEGTSVAAASEGMVIEL